MEITYPFTGIHIPGMNPIKVRLLKMPCVQASVTYIYIHIHTQRITISLIQGINKKLSLGKMFYKQLDQPILFLSMPYQWKVNIYPISRKLVLADFLSIAILLVFYKLSVVSHYSTYQRVPFQHLWKLFFHFFSPSFLVWLLDRVAWVQTRYNQTMSSPSQ